MRSWRIAAAVALGIAVVAIAFLPFNQPALGNAGLAISRTCGAPVLSAWRSDPPVSGWFGYAPLTGTPLQNADLPVAMKCRIPARHRLVDAGFLALAASAVLLLPRRNAGSAPTGHTVPAIE